MFPNLSIIFLSALYFPLMAIWGKLSQKRTNFYIFSYYFRSIYFSILTFACSIALSTNIQAILASKSLSSLAFWSNIIGLTVILVILLSIVRQMIRNMKAFVNDGSQPHAMHMISTYVINVIIVFAFLYFCIYTFNTASFSGISVANSQYTTYFDFIYFSFITFATIGYGDIYPVSQLAKLIVIVQIILFYIVIGIGFASASKKKEK